MPFSTTTVISGCYISIGGSVYIANSFQIQYEVDQIPTARCTVVIGKDIIGGVSYNSSKLFDIIAGTEAEITMAGKHNGNDFNLKLFKGYVSTIHISAGAGGGAQASLSYSVEIVLVHVSGAFSAYQIGNRVFTPKNQKREAFIKAPDAGFLELHANVTVKGVSADNVSKFIIGLVNKFIAWEFQYLKNAPSMPTLTAPDCILDLSNQSVTATKSNIYSYVRRIVLSALTNTQNGGTFFTLISTLCNLFMLKIIPTYTGLSLSPILPVFKFDRSKCYLFSTRQYITGISRASNMAEILPPDAIWVPNERHVPYIDDSVKKPRASYDPLNNSSPQPHPEYFKYPQNVQRTNGQIMEPPPILKQLLCGEIEEVKKANPVALAITTIRNNSKVNNKVTKDKTDLNGGIGILAAKLLYCMHAFENNSCNLQFNIAAIASGWMTPIGPLGKICKFLFLDNTNKPCTQVGYCRAITIAMNRDSNVFDYVMSLDHIRSEQEDNATSLDMKTPLLYKEVNNP